MLRICWFSFKPVYANFLTALAGDGVIKNFLRCRRLQTNIKQECPTGVVNRPYGV